MRAHGFAGFLVIAAVGLLHQASLASAHFSCQKPQQEQEFCNALYTACLSSPKKQCFANTIFNCIGDIDLPQQIVITLWKFIRRFIQIITDPIIEPPPPTLPPPTFPPPTLPPPTFPPPTLPPPTLPPPTLPPYTFPPLITNSPIIPVWPPYTLPPTTRRPTYPPVTPETIIVPIIVTSSTKPPVTAPPIFIISLPTETITETTMKPVIQTTAKVIGPTFEIIYDTSSYFLDYILSVFDSMEEIYDTQVIRNYYNYLLFESTEALRDQFYTDVYQDADVLNQKIIYLIKYFSKGTIVIDDLYSQLNYIKSNDDILYKWFARVVEELSTSLGIRFQLKTVDVTYPQDFYEIIYTLYETTEEVRRTAVSCYGDITIARCENYCTDYYGGNWIAIQSRERANEVNGMFNRNIEDYITGFGQWGYGYWMGLECIHAITNNEDRNVHYELLVELANADGQTAIAHYGNFSIGDASTGYELRLGEYLGGAAGDALRSSVGKSFTALNFDVDDYINGNCAEKHEGAWWYGNCQKFSVKNFLNGYFSEVDFGASNSILNFPYFGVRWETLDSPTVLVATRMFVRLSPTIGIYQLSMQEQLQQTLFLQGEQQQQQQLQQHVFPSQQQDQLQQQQLTLALQQHEHEQSQQQQLQQQQFSFALQQQEELQQQNQQQHGYGIYNNDDGPGYYLRK